MCKFTFLSGFGPLYKLLFSLKLRLALSFVSPLILSSLANSSLSLYLILVFPEGLSWSPGPNVDAMTMSEQTTLYISNFTTLCCHWVSVGAQAVKNPPAMWETWVQSLGCKDLEKGMATHSSIPAWRIPMDRGAWWATVRGVAKSRTWLSD